MITTNQQHPFKMDEELKSMRLGIEIFSERDNDIVLTSDGRIILYAIHETN